MFTRFWLFLDLNFGPSRPPTTPRQIPLSLVFGTSIHRDRQQETWDQKCTTGGNISRQRGGSTERSCIGCLFLSSFHTNSSLPLCERADGGRAYWEYYLWLRYQLQRRSKMTSRKAPRLRILPPRLRLKMETRTTPRLRQLPPRLRLNLSLVNTRTHIDTQSERHKDRKNKRDRDRDRDRG